VRGQLCRHQRRSAAKGMLDKAAEFSRYQHRDKSQGFVKRREDGIC